MRLIFVRHGDPDYKNDCLTEAGRAQAARTAERLAKEPIRAVYSSPMGRTMETASYTAEKLGMEIQQLDFMHEISWGGIPDADGNPKPIPFNGHPWFMAIQFLMECPELVGSMNWREHPYFRDNLCMNYYALVSAEFDKFLAGFGLERKNGLYVRKRPCDDTVVLFAHGGSGAIMYAHVLNLPFPFVLTSLTYGVCSISVIDFTLEQDGIIIPQLALFNDMSHLADLMSEQKHFDN